MRKIVNHEYDGNNRRSGVLDRLGRAPLVIVSLFAVLAILVFAITSTNHNAARFAKQSAERQADNKAQSEFNAKLLEVVQTFNERHAKAAGESFDVLVQNQICFTDFFFDFNQALNTNQIPPLKARLDACFKPSTPQPTPPIPPTPPPRSDREKP